MPTVRPFQAQPSAPPVQTAICLARGCRHALRCHILASEFHGKEAQAQESGRGDGMQSLREEGSPCRAQGRQAPCVSLNGCHVNNAQPETCVLSGKTTIIAAWPVWQLHRAPHQRTTAGDRSGARWPVPGWTASLSSSHRINPSLSAKIQSLPRAAIASSSQSSGRRDGDCGASALC